MTEDYDDDPVLDWLFADVRAGFYNVNWNDDTGMPHFSLTAKGLAQADDLLAKIAQTLGGSDHGV